MGPFPAADGQALASSQEADEAGGRSLWEAAANKADGEAKPRRALKRKTTDEQVEKSLYDNFRTFTPTEIDGTVVEGKTLRQRLQEDKRLQRADPKNHPMGQRYYAQLRDMYASTEHANKRLQVKDPSLSVAPALMKAMIAVQAKGSANRGALIGWMSTAPAVNQKEPKKLKKTHLGMNPSFYVYCLLVLVECISAIVCFMCLFLEPCQLYDCMCSLLIYSRLDWTPPGVSCCEVSLVSPWLQKPVA